MLPLSDPHVRLVLLGHIASRAAAGATAELSAAGILQDQLGRLRELSAMDLINLANMRAFPIGVTFELSRLEGALRSVSMLNRAKAIELYFIRNGASSRMMHALFKSRHKATRTRRRSITPTRTRPTRRSIRGITCRDRRSVRAAAW